MLHDRLRAIFVTMLLVVSVGTAAKTWNWYWRQVSMDNTNGEVALTFANARAAVMRTYGATTDLRVVEGAFVTTGTGAAYSTMYLNNSNQGCSSPYFDERPANNTSVAATYSKKHAIWFVDSPSEQQSDRVFYTRGNLNEVAWTDTDTATVSSNMGVTSYGSEFPIALTARRNGLNERVYACFWDINNTEAGLWVHYSVDNGANWSLGEKVLQADDASVVNGLSMAAQDGHDTAYIAFGWESSTGPQKVRVMRSTSQGVSWTSIATWGNDDYDYYRPSVAVLGTHVIVAMLDDDGQVRWATSTNSGSSWSDLEYVDEHAYPRDWDYFSPNVSLTYDADLGMDIVTLSTVVSANSCDAVSVCHARWDPVTNSVYGWSGRWINGDAYFMIDGDVSNPSSATFAVPGGATHAFCSYVDDAQSAGGYAGSLWHSTGVWADPSIQWPPVTEPDDAVGTQRDLRLSQTGNLIHAVEVPGDVLSGPVLSGSFLAPVVVDVGSGPALALDGADRNWVAYIRSDSVFCMVARRDVKLLWTSEGIVPRQLSIVTHPTLGDDGYVGNIVFAAYDTAAGTSAIIYAKVDSSQVLVDTIATSETAADSFPCINVAGSDSIYVTWQRGDSVKCSLAADYAAGTWTSPTWSSSTIGTGIHPMSQLEGDYLHCVWRSTEADGYGDTLTAISHKAFYAGSDTSIFAGWVACGDASENDELVKDGAVYAGAGVTVYQQNDGGKWTIHAQVRGDTVTLVDSDTGAYHPHAVAESSAISPSIDQVRVNLLWTQGVVFEVDSGVYDTGESRYKVDSFSVSNAGAAATGPNNGAKLVRKPDSDSLFAVYADANGAIVYAWSADGSDWQRSIVDTRCRYPALAFDGAGNRFVVMRTDARGTTRQKIVGRYLCGDTWSTVQNLCQAVATGETLGAPSLVGSSSSTARCAYVAFASISSATSALRVVKFNGTNAITSTVTSLVALTSPPSIGVQGVDTTDYLHVTWSQGNDAVYTVCKSAVQPAAWGAMWSVQWETPYNVSMSSGTATLTPVLAVGDTEVGIAWTEGTVGDIYLRTRILPNTAYYSWGDTVNLSQSAGDSSRAPVLSMDSVPVVVWQEDLGDTVVICASVNRDEPVVIKHCDHDVTLPHIAFRNEEVGDTTIPYAHVIWSESPTTNYYEVGYAKCDLRQPGGGGQQSQGNVPTRLTRLEACRPNPFSGRTTISYQCGQAGVTKLAVFDVSGRVVRTLSDGFQPAGRYSVTWDGTATNGRRVPAGVYVYRLDAAGQRLVKKAVITR